MNCNDVRIALDGRVADEPLESAVAAHVARCADCAAHAATLESLDRRLRAMHARIDVPSDFDARLRARLAREQERRTPAVDRGTVEHELGGWLRRLRRESLLDAGGLVGGGAALALAAWQIAPETAQWFAALDSGAGLLGMAVLSAAATLGVAWIAVGGAWRSLGAK
jgi:anti-sigma factor RsiW